jgi:hypothetical protein
VNPRLAKATAPRELSTAWAEGYAWAKSTQRSMSTDADGRSKPTDGSSRLTEDGPVAIRSDAESDR